MLFRRFIEPPNGPMLPAVALRAAEILLSSSVPMSLALTCNIEGFLRHSTIISKRSLASLASSTPMASACRRSSDLVLGESSLIAFALVMPPLQHDRTGPVL